MTHPDFPASPITPSHGPSPFSIWLRRFLCRTAIVWWATIAITAGYVIACQIVYTTNADLQVGQPLNRQIELQYNASTLANYYRNQTGLAPGAPLPANASAAIAKLKWPKAQPTYSSIRTGLTEQFTFGYTTVCMTCTLSGKNPSSFPYGMYPFGCCYGGNAFAQCFVSVLFPTVFSLVLTIGMAWVCRILLARYSPLHEGLAEKTRRTSKGELASAPSTSSDSGSGLKASEAAEKLPDLGLPDATLLPAPAVGWRKGRPCFDDELCAIASTSRGRIIVYSCGPGGLQQAVRKSVYGKADGRLEGRHLVLREFTFAD